jgi:hypothetical protein
LTAVSFSAVDDRLADARARGRDGDALKVYGHIYDRKRTGNAVRAALAASE